VQTIKWNPGYSVGVRELDEQHQRLLAIYNKLVQALSSGQADKAAYPALQELADYLNYHFTTEEKYMETYGFPGYAEHKTEHEQFRDEVIRFLRAVNEDESMVTVKIHRFVSSWLSNHIYSLESADKGYCQFFRECGLK
jgi:hemerythrin